MKALVMNGTNFVNIYYSSNENETYNQEVLEKINDIAE